MTNTIEKKSANFDIESLDLLEKEGSLYTETNNLPQTGEKYLVFYLGEKMYGVLSKNIAEIFQPTSITPLFNAPQWLLGIAGFRNEVISVIDLKKLWNKNSAPSSPKSRLIVIRSEISASPIAFAVDKLNKIVTLPDNEIKPFKEKNVPNISGIISYKSKTLHLLDAKEILSSLTF